MTTPPHTITDGLPDPVAAERFLEDLAAKDRRRADKLARAGALRSDVLTLVSYSPLLAATLLQNPEHIAWLERKRVGNVTRGKAELLESLARFSMTNSQVEPHILLARFRRRELSRIFLRDIRRLATVAEITEELSNLADAVLEHALRLARQELDNRYGNPLEVDEKGRKKPADICIVSLGKLGSRELNYASDIDLLFVYSGEGETSGTGSRGGVTNREYFIKLAEAVTALVGKQIGEGAAYRVDLRLRPHGRVGPLAMSLADTIRYYTGEAAAWERQVLIRSRASAGAERLYRAFAVAVEGSVFSADVPVAQALTGVRESKQKIDISQITAKGINVKLGRGGIREIEFIAQALQLAYGGRDPWLRTPHTLIILVRLADRRLLSEAELTELSDAYAFLRRVEHLLQMEHGLQTHTVPRTADRLELLARRMNFAASREFESELDRHLANVHRVYERIFAREFADASAAGETEKGIDAVQGTSTAENDDAPAPTIANGINALAAHYPRLGEMLAARPASADRIEQIKSDAASGGYHARLADAVKRAGDLKGEMSALRRTWSEILLGIVALDAGANISSSESKRMQAELAEAAIAAALDISANEMRRRRPEWNGEPALAVMALGKLGGGSMDYDSDLDLVVVHGDAAAEFPDCVTPNQFYSRAVEIFVNALSAITRDGSLYRVDLRLRPYGSQGANVTGRAAFAEYIRSSAAIWELLAFVKLRGVAGPHELAAAVEAEIRELIHTRAAEVDPTELTAETRRIRLSLENQRTDRRRTRDIDIKYGEGGMLDIYFAVRYLQLRDGLADSTEHRSTADTLERLGHTASLTAEQLEPLAAGYAFLAELDHNLRLTVGRTTRVPLANITALTTIARRMNLANPDTLLHNLTAHRLDIRSAFNTLVPPDADSEEP